MKWLSLIAVLLLGLLFVDFPENNNNQVFKEFWETGHIVLFALLVFLLFQFDHLRTQSPLNRFLITSFFCLIIGLATELLQLLFARSFELKDIFHDLIGGYIGLILAQLKTEKKRSNIIANTLMLSALSLVGGYSLIIATINQWYIEQSFPILSNFESPLELSRWESIEAEISLSKLHKKQGKYSMKVDFLPGNAPRAQLFNFVSDWSGHQFLKFSIYNNALKPEKVSINIYDHQYRDTGYQYSDRFVLNATIKKGWNEFSIPIKNIRKAPALRDMRIESVLSFGIWMRHLKKPVSLYVDDIRLTQ